MDDYVIFDPKIPKYQPKITKVLILLISTMFLVELFFNAIYSDKALIILGAKWNEGITKGQYWRFLSCTFLHGNILHLFVNIAALHIFGREVESIYGSFRFLVLFLLSSWGASLTSYICSPWVSIGASGALFGIIGGLVIFFFRQKDVVTEAGLKFKSMYTLIIINLLFGFLFPRIDNSAHIGGLITGLLTSWFIVPEYKIHKNKDKDRLVVIQKPNLSRLICGLILVITILFWLTSLSIKRLSYLHLQECC